MCDVDVIKFGIFHFLCVCLQPLRAALSRVRRTVRSKQLEEKAQAHGNFQLFRDYPTITPQPLRHPSGVLSTDYPRKVLVIYYPHAIHQHTHKSAGRASRAGGPRPRGSETSDSRVTV
jgi:hypothetical protein